MVAVRGSLWQPERRLSQLAQSVAEDQRHPSQAWVALVAADQLPCWEPEVPAEADQRLVWEPEVLTEVLHCLQSGSPVERWQPVAG